MFFNIIVWQEVLLMQIDTKLQIQSTYINNVSNLWMLNTLYKHYSVYFYRFYFLAGLALFLARLQNESKDKWWVKYVQRNYSMISHKIFISQVFSSPEDHTYKCILRCAQSDNYMNND